MNRWWMLFAVSAISAAVYIPQILEDEFIYEDVNLISVPPNTVVDIPILGRRAVHIEIEVLNLTEVRLWTVDGTTKNYIFSDTMKYTGKATHIKIQCLGSCLNQTATICYHTLRTSGIKQQILEYTEKACTVSSVLSITMMIRERRLLSTQVCLGLTFSLSLILYMLSPKFNGNILEGVIRKNFY